MSKDNWWDGLSEKSDIQLGTFSASLSKRIAEAKTFKEMRATKDAEDINVQEPTYDSAGFFGALWEFQKAFAKKAFLDPNVKLQSLGQAFKPGSPSAELSAKLNAEEFGELAEELGPNGTAENVLKELCDCLYVLVRIAVIYGWPLEEAFARVHENNMLKLETCTLRHDGKLIKAANHPKVYLKDLV